MKEAYDEMMKLFAKFIEKHVLTMDFAEDYKALDKKQKKCFMDCIRLLDAVINYAEETMNYQVRVEQKLDRILKEM